MAMTRKRPLEDPNQYYTYVWKLDGEVLWVGQGKNNRGRPTAKACWNGRPEALKAILRKRCAEIEWTVFPCDSKADSEDLERKLIIELKPKYNTATQKGGWKGMHSAEGIANIRKAQIGRPTSPELREKRRQRMMGNQLRKGK